MPCCLWPWTLTLAQTANLGFRQPMAIRHLVHRCRIVLVIYHLKLHAGWCIIKCAMNATFKVQSAQSSCGHVTNTESVFITRRHLPTQHTHDDSAWIKKNSVIWHDTIRHDLFWFGMMLQWHWHVWFDMAGLIWYDMICDVYDMSCDMIWYDIIYDMIWYDTIYDMTWHDIYCYGMIWVAKMYDMLWYDTWYVMIWYELLRYDMIWYDMIWYDMNCYNFVWYVMICYDGIWYDVMWCDMIQ